MVIVDASTGRQRELAEAGRCLPRNPATRSRLESGRTARRSRRRAAAQRGLHGPRRRWRARAPVDAPVLGSAGMAARHRLNRMSRLSSCNWPVASNGYGPQHLDRPDRRRLLLRAPRDQSDPRDSCSCWWREQRGRWAARTTHLGPPPIHPGPAAIQRANAGADSDPEALVATRGNAHVGHQRVVGRQGTARPRTRQHSGVPEPAVLSGRSPALLRLGDRAPGRARPRGRHRAGPRSLPRGSLHRSRFSRRLSDRLRGRRLTRRPRQGRSRAHRRLPDANSTALAWSPQGTGWHSPPTTGCGSSTLKGPTSERC